MNMRDWVKLPSAWMEDCGLSAFRWRAGAGSSETAALMVLLAIAHRAGLDNGIARITYDELTIATGISRTKVSDGLGILADRDLVNRAPEGRSTYQLTNYGPDHIWAALPAKPLYDRSGAIRMLGDFHLRQPAELNTIKIYLALAARRDHKQNVTWITYDQISNYAGVHLGQIKRAIAILIINGLINVDSYWREGKPGKIHGYRLQHLFPSRHAGTTGRTISQQNDAPEYFDLDELL